MKTTTHTQALLRKRKMMLVMPLLVLPFLTIAFWALGGGRSGEQKNSLIAVPAGLNLQLPGANLKEDKPLDKLSYYEKAAADSSKYREMMRSDPYFKLSDSGSQVLSTELYNDTDLPVPATNGLHKYSRLNNTVSSGTHDVDAGETKLYQKLAALKNALNNSSTSLPSNDNPDAASSDDSHSIDNRNSTNQLESTLQQVKQKGSGNDPEMEQINAMLDKIMTIQHPERIQPSITEYKTGIVPALAVNANSGEAAVSVMTTDSTGRPITFSPDSMADNEQNAFYSSDDRVSTVTQPSNAIAAVINDDQTMVDGSIIKLRLTQDVVIQGLVVFSGQFVYGTVSLGGERLHVEINNIRVGNHLLPVALTVYDADGLKGIYIPGAINRDVLKQSTANAIQSVALSSLDPSVGAQAVGAGIEAAKALISKKVKLVKVQVKAGYQVLLKDNRLPETTH